MVFPILKWPSDRMCAVQHDKIWGDRLVGGNIHMKNYMHAIRQVWIVWIGVVARFFMHAKMGG